MRRISLRRRLGEIVILHRNDEDSADSMRMVFRRCLRSKQNTGYDTGEQRCLAPEPSEQKSAKSGGVVSVIVVDWWSDTELSFHGILCCFGFHVFRHRATKVNVTFVIIRLRKWRRCDSGVNTSGLRQRACRAADDKPNFWTCASDNADRTTRCVRQSSLI